MSELSRKQKRELSQKFERAFRLEAARLRGAGRVAAEGNFTAGSYATLQEALEAMCLNGSNACLETWRHEQVAIACGKHGLRLCSQQDYNPVLAHVEKLLGEDGKSFKADVRGGGEAEARRQARHNIAAALRRWGLHPNYAEAICRNVHKVELDDATSAVLMRVLYTINNRGAKKTRETRSNAPCPHQEALV
jgi:hypothetical protein